jgi:hypothetical protein
MEGTRTPPCKGNFDTKRVCCFSYHCLCVGLFDCHWWAVSLSQQRSLDGTRCMSISGLSGVNLVNPFRWSCIGEVDALLMLDNDWHERVVSVGTHGYMEVESMENFYGNIDTTMIHTSHSLTSQCVNELTQFETFQSIGRFK